MKTRISMLLFAHAMAAPVTNEMQAKKDVDSEEIQETAALGVGVAALGAALVIPSIRGAIARIIPSTHVAANSAHKGHGQHEPT
jgi:hypothetical protein